MWLAWIATLHEQKYINVFNSLYMMLLPCIVLHGPFCIISGTVKTVLLFVKTCKLYYSARVTHNLRHPYTIWMQQPESGNI